MARRRWGRRLAGALVLLLLAELALQAAAPLVQRSMARREPDPSPDAPLTILCVGDSNTYGLHMPRLYAYPAMLEARLAQRFREPVAVVNRGVPGQNTAQVGSDLAQDLADTHPDVVLVLCGINDAWNTGAEDRGLSGALEQLKLVRLVRVLLSGVTTAAPFEVRTDERGEMVVDRGSGARRVNAGEGGGSLRSGEALQAHVIEGLSRILERCADAGATPVLMTYAESAGEFAGINAAVRALAAERGVLLVDHERAFGERFAAGEYHGFMMNDHHPNLRGYQLMAAEVDAVLTGAGWVPAAAEGASAALPDDAGAVGTAGDATPAVPATLELLPGDRLRLGGPPLAPFQLLMSHRPGSDDGFDVGSRRVPLPTDKVMAMSRLEPGFSGQLDAHGRAELSIPARLRAAAGDEGLAACLLLLGDPLAASSPGGAALLGVSEPLLLPD
jgi:lysophospholipase L1-like esterase